MARAQAWDTLLAVDVVDSARAELFVGQNASHLSTDENRFANTADAGQLLQFGTSLGLAGNGPGLLATPALRGTNGEGTQVFWNGMPVNSPTLGLSDLSLFPVSSFDDMTLIAGGDGAQLGSGAVGGSILLSQNGVFKKQKQIFVNDLAGSFGRWQRSAGASFSNEKNYLKLSLNGQWARNDFRYETPFGDTVRQLNSDFKNVGFNVSAGHKFSQEVDIQTFLWYQEAFRELPASSVQFNSISPAVALQADDQLRWQTIFNLKNLTVEQGFSWEEQYYEDEKFNLSDSNNFFQSSTEIRYQILERDNWQWDAGGYLNYYEAFGTNVEATQREYGLRSGLTWRPWLLSRKFLARVSLAQNFVDQNAVALLPSLGAEWQFYKNFVWKAKIAGVYDNPTLNERFWPGGGNPDILPESGWSGETSLNWNKKFWNFSTQNSVTYFYQNLENRVVWRPVGRTYGPFNVNRVRTQGMEIYTENQWRPFPKTFLKLTGSATLVRPHLLGNSSSGETPKLLPFVEERVAAGSITAKVRGVFGYLSARYGSGAFTDLGNDPFAKLKPYVILNAGIGTSFKLRKIELTPTLVLNNLTNENYQLYASRPMPGLHFSFSLNTRFLL